MQKRNVIVEHGFVPDLSAIPLGGTSVTLGNQYIYFIFRDPECKKDETIEKVSRKKRSKNKDKKSKRANTAT